MQPILSSKYFWPMIILASFFIALLTQLFNHNPINVDGILYIEVAKYYQSHGLQAAMSIYPWPFYSVILSYIHNPFWFNNILITLMIIFWILILKEFKPSIKILYWGVLLILIFPSLNHLRAFVIRDAGYWAFLFIGLFYLFQSLKQDKFLYIILYTLSFFIATLFRIEGAVVWALAPCIFLVLNQYKTFFKYELFFGILIILIFLWKLWSHEHHFAQLGRVSDFWEIFKQTAQGLTHDFLEDLIGTVTVLYGLLALYGLYKIPVSPQKKLLYWLLMIQLAIPLIFTFQSGISTDRYIMPFALTLILAVPFALENLPKVLLGLILIILCIMAYGGIIPFGTSKVYLTESGLWLKTHSKNTDKIYSNSREVLFYAGRSTIDWQFSSTPDKILLPLTNDSWKSYNYIAVRLDKNNIKILQPLVNRLSLQPVKVFQNNRNDKVMIFYVSR